MTTTPKTELAERIREKCLETINELEARRKADCERHRPSAEEIKSALANPQKLFDAAKQRKAARKPNDQRQFECRSLQSGFETAMITEPNAAPADDTREKLLNAVRDEPLLKQLLAGTAAGKLLDQAVALICKRMDSRELSNDMLLRIIRSLARSTDYAVYAAMTWPRHLKRPGQASRSGGQRRRRTPRTQRQSPHHQSRGVRPQ